MPNLARFLQDRIRRQPDAAAIHHDGDVCSYGRFGERIARLASGLRGRLGLSAGDRVLLWMENRPEFLELLFACWHAGLIAVPANARLHPKEIAHIVADSGARCPAR